MTEALAVLGDGCELQHAAEISEVEMDSAARQAGWLVRLEVLAGDEPSCFLYPIVREAVDASLAGDERAAPRSMSGQACRQIAGVPG